jgi:hypothetical protein
MTAMVGNLNAFFISVVEVPFILLYKNYSHYEMSKSC